MTLPATKEALYHAIGVAVERWSFVELTLSLHFQVLTQAKIGIAKAVYFSARSFRGKQDMLDAAIKSVDGVEGFPQYIAYLKAASKRSGQWSGARNILVHGRVMEHSDPKSAYLGRSAIIDATEDQNNPKRLMFAPDIVNMAEGFGKLSLLNLVAYRCLFDQKLQKSHQECLELVQLLPNRADHISLPPSTLKRFESLSELLRGFSFPV